MDMLSEEFLKLLKEDPKKALSEMGIEPTEEILASLEKLDMDALHHLLTACASQRKTAAMEAFAP